MKSVRPSAVSTFRTSTVTLTISAHRGQSDLAVEPAEVRKCIKCQERHNISILG